MVQQIADLLDDFIQVFEDEIETDEELSKAPEQFFLRQDIRYFEALAEKLLQHAARMQDKAQTNK